MFRRVLMAAAVVMIAACSGSFGRGHAGPGTMLFVAPQNPDRALGVLHQRRLRDLELERRRRDSMRAERLADLIEEATLLQLAQRQVH